MNGTRTASFVVDRVLAAATPGGIVLMHVVSHRTDHSTLDAAALPGIVAGCTDADTRSPPSMPCYLTTRRQGVEDQRERYPPAAGRGPDRLSNGAAGGSCCGHRRTAVHRPAGAATRPPPR